MQVTKVSPLTQRENTLDLDITQGQVDQWQGGTLIQDVMPHLSLDEREFLISGTLPGEFEKMFGEVE